MDGAQVLEVVLLCQDEHHSIVTVSAAWMNLDVGEGKELLILLVARERRGTRSTSKVIETEVEFFGCQAQFLCPVWFYFIYVGSLSHRDSESTNHQSREGGGAGQGI